jgi:hypothetical protein
MLCVDTVVSGTCTRLRVLVTRLHSKQIPVLLVLCTQGVQYNTKATYSTLYSRELFLRPKSRLQNSSVQAIERPNYSSSYYADIHVQIAS